jgi:hypothetical protein
MKLRGVATEDIPFGASVLCRGFKVALAGPEIANGTADTPKYPRGTLYKAGDYVVAESIEGIGGRDLHAMANAPLMDANQIFLPAGKLSMAEYRARVAADLAADGEPPP